MSSKIKSEPVEKYVMTSGNEPQPATPTPAKEEPTENEPHDDHTFEWKWRHNSRTLTCNSPGTVEDVLKRSQYFQGIAMKNTDKELVIEIVEKPPSIISSHFPCCLIRDKHLIIKFFPRDKTENACSRPEIIVRSGKLVTFRVQAKGGKDIKMILKNAKLRNDYPEITVYAYRGEEVHEALRRDGRFIETIFTENCILCDTSTKVNTEMSSPVDAHNGKTFIMNVYKVAPSPRVSKTGNRGNASLSQKQSDKSEDPSGPADSTQSVSENPSENPSNPAITETFREIPDSEKMRGHLIAKFEIWVKEFPNLKNLPNFLHVEFGKNAEACSEVKTMKRLMHLSDSVCQVRINGKARGSGFLLFDKFVLTNAHVVQEIDPGSTGQLAEKITIHFSFESLGGEQPGVEVEEIVGRAYCHKTPGDKCDWALLKLSNTDETLPESLLKHYKNTPLQCGGIFIIGHPAGGVKKIDPCFIVPFEDQKTILDKCSHENPEGVYEGKNRVKLLLTRNFIKKLQKNLKRNNKTLKYETCFFFGASGSPVFDKDCNVVAMHSGGYTYENQTGQLQSVIEFGFVLSDIMEQMITQIVETKRWDVLKEYLAFDYRGHTHVKENVKRLFSSRDQTYFREEVNDPAFDENSKEFLEFVSQSEEPVAKNND